MDLLLPYQRRWCADQSRVQVAEKSRRIGVTWASAIRAVIESGRSDGWDTFYTGYKFSLAEEFIREAGDFARALGVEVREHGQFMFDDTDDAGETRQILASRIVFASGHRIVALSSSPRNMRGIQGRVIIDEFAFHDNPAELLKAAMATLIWGGKVSIISTHNGEDNPFNRLIQDIHAGRFDYSLHRTTLDDAIAEGLYDRVATITGRVQSDVDRAAWRDEIVKHYGDGADEELFCIPRKSGGVYISSTLIEACMRADYSVHRLKLEDRFALLSDAEQAAEIRPWLDTVVTPACKALDAKRPVFLGEDFGRRSDLTAIALGQEGQDLTLRVPALFELRNVPFETQKQIVLHVCREVPMLGRAAVDSSGNGMYLGEVLAQHYGDEIVHRVGIAVEVGSGEHAETRSLAWIKWYAEQLPKFKARFEDGTIAIPRDYDVRNDLTAFQVVNGVPVLPKVRTESKAPDAGAGSMRHGDAGVALALCEYACRMGALDITSIQRVGRAGSQYPHKSTLQNAKRIW